MNRWSLVGREESGQCVLVSIATATALVLNGMEFAYLVETDSRTKQWSWLFEGYPQWHAVALKAV
jgi:hypothetical protein